MIQEEELEMKPLDPHKSDAPLDRFLPSVGVAPGGALFDGSRAMLTRQWTRRGFLRAVALGGATLVTAPLASPFGVTSAVAATGAQDFTFAVLADSHTMGNRNPVMKLRLEAAIRQINALNPAPDFVMYLGDAIHDGTPEQFKYFAEIIAGLKPPVYFLAGEHDWYLDMGEYYLDRFIRRPAPYYSFDHKGAHIIALHGSNLNDFWTVRRLTPEERMHIAGTVNDIGQGPFLLGKAQLDWIEKDLAKVPKDTPLLVFNHTPLYRYFRPWNLWIEDAEEIQALLKPFKTVQVFHAHVHHLVEHAIGNIRFHGALATSWPHPYPDTYHTLGLQGQMPRSNPANLFDGLGWQRGKVAARGAVTHEDILWTLAPPSIS